MATNYLKPQSPLKKIDKQTGDINYMYPLTTPDQIVMEDGRRLNAVLDELSENTPDIDLSELNIITVDLEGSTEGTPATIDADTFQGYSIDRFVMYNVGGGDGEDVPSIEATSGVSIDLESAEESGQPVAVDADTLGGYPAEYFLENAGTGGGDVTVNLDGAEQSGQASTVNADLLGGIPASGYVKKSELDTSGMELLWENPDPSVEFPAQTVNIDWSSYKYIKIIPSMVSTATIISSIDIPCKSDMTASMNYTYYSPADSKLYIHMRNLFFINNGIKFENAEENGSVNNIVCIPCQIYGIKDASIVSGGAGNVDLSDYATKAEVEAAQTTANNAVKKAGDTMTGHLSMADSHALSFVKEKRGTGTEFRMFKDENDGVFHLSLYTDNVWTKNILRVNSDGSILENNIGIGKDLLWQNANISSSFPAQTVKINNISQYKFLVVFYRLYTNESRCSSMMLFKNDSNTLMPFSSGVTSQPYRYVRTSNEGVVFLEGYNSNNQGGTTVDNNYIIPDHIMGFK